MGPRNHADDTLAADLAALQQLSRGELKQRWADLYGSACPVRMSRVLLVRALAYRMQERALLGRPEPGFEVARQYR